MNIKLIGLLLVLSVPLTAWADMAGFHGDSSQRVERLSKELGLNDEQKTKVTAIFEAQKEKFKALHDEMDASLKAVLTPEQMAKFEAHKAKHQEARKEQMHDMK